MRLILVNFELKRLPSIMLVGLIQSDKGLKEKKDRALSARGNSLADHWLSWDSSIANLHNHESQFIILNLFLYIHMSYWFSFYGDP